MDYLKDPTAIYAKSFATIRDEVDFTALPTDIGDVVERMIHACGMTDLAADVAYSDNVVASATRALQNGAPIITDCEMVRSGIIASLLPTGNEVMCFLNHDQVPSLARHQKTTRSAAQVSLWHEQLVGSIVVIGNAPTALFALLEAIDAGAPKPAAILASPVGFVGAAESKAELAANPRGVPFITLTGRRGGSAIASASLNAISKLARDKVAA
ncbi:MAG: precorrin-8X methylmutase [Hyphomicrobiales bacterium]